MFRRTRRGARWPEAVRRTMNDDALCWEGIRIVMEAAKTLEDLIWEGLGMI